MRALLLVLDSVGVGGAPDAANYGDEGANTLGHILESVPDLRIPSLMSLGLDLVLSGNAPAPPGPAASYGRMRESSAGKDTTTGHWELGGVLLEKPFATFPEFPAELVAAIEKAADIKFIGNYAQSGTVILEELGKEHCQTGHPILYTSADSVLQIAAHEQVVPLRRLYNICRAARKVADQYRIGRVIARPFTGEEGNFERTANRHDFSIVPPRTVLNAIAEAGLVVHGVGKVVDIYARSGITHAHRTKNNIEGMKVIEALWHDMQFGLIVANLVDFDALYGHRRDPKGYAEALSELDEWLGGFLPRVEYDDLMIITADHGNDPTYGGTDHTREEVPVLVRFDHRAGPLGTRETFADVAATLNDFFGLKKPWPVGESFFKFAHAVPRPHRH